MRCDSLAAGCVLRDCSGSGGPDTRRAPYSRGCRRLRPEKQPRPQIIGFRRAVCPGAGEGSTQPGPATGEYQWPAAGQHHHSHQPVTGRDCRRYGGHIYPGPVWNPVQRHRRHRSVAVAVQPVVPGGHQSRQDLRRILPAQFPQGEGRRSLQRECLLLQRPDQCPATGNSAGQPGAAPATGRYLTGAVPERRTQEKRR